MKHTTTDRNGKITDYTRYTRKLAIILKCRDCAGFQQNEALKCEIFDCPLWPYRGNSPEELPEFQF